jgi:hypothetical protein
MQTAELKKLFNQKITEHIFQYMFREAGKYTVIPIGYEATAEELEPYKRHAYVRKVLDNLKAAPDFVLISKDKTDVIVVEVEYIAKAEPEDIGDMVHTVLRRWDPSYVFIATQTGFYFDSCNSVKAENGHIKLLSEHWVKMDMQHKYLELLHYYVK